MTASPLLECVPNFSEGRRPEVIGRIVAQLASVPGAQVLDVSSGAAANRTVVTLAGHPDAVTEAAFRGIRTAVESIDMRSQQGVHPRIGAADVVPLVPLRGVSMDDAVALAHALGARVGADLGVPVYHYGEAARSDRPSGLAALRRGQLEGLQARLEAGRLPPDAGPDRWSERVARSGASAVGARGFLVALNATLTTGDVSVARDIAERIRSRGPVLRSADGAVVRDPRGRPRRGTGPFPGVRAIGWRIEEYGRAQVSMNLVSPLELSVLRLIERVETLALAAGAGVAGCELIGLMPEPVLARVGRESGASKSLAEAGFDRLRLDHLRPLDVEDVVLESQMRRYGLL